MVLGSTVMVVTGTEVEVVEVDVVSREVVEVAEERATDSVEKIGNELEVGAARVAAGERMSAGTLKPLWSQAASA